jgi:hypothetical protein
MTRQRPPPAIKDLKFESAGQDLEELLASKENLLELSAIISRNWSVAIEEDNNYIRIYPDAKAVCCCLQGLKRKRGETSVEKLHVLRKEKKRKRG